jgi:hypothetical protein
MQMQSWAIMGIRSGDLKPLMIVMGANEGDCLRHFEDGKHNVIDNLMKQVKTFVLFRWKQLTEKIGKWEREVELFQLGKQRGVEWNVPKNSGPSEDLKKE